MPPNVLEAPVGEEEDLYEAVEQEEDGADDVQVEHGLVYTQPVLPPNVLEAPAGEEEDLYEDVEQEEEGADDVQVDAQTGIHSPCTASECSGSPCWRAGRSL